MKKSQSGFTLIELVVVIVLLGILGVTALGKFQDLSTNAADAALEGLAAEISGSSSVNYANSLLGSSEACIGTAVTAGTAPCATGGTEFDTGTPANACSLTNLQSLLLTTLPTTINGETIAPVALVADPCSAGAGNTYSCQLEAPAGSTDVVATATLICTE